MMKFTTIKVLLLLIFKDSQNTTLKFTNIIKKYITFKILKICSGVSAYFTFKLGRHNSPFSESKCIQHDAGCGE